MNYKVGRINQLTGPEHGGDVAAFGAPAVITPVVLTGQIEGWHYCAKTGLHKEAFKDANTIDNELKAIIRDNLNSPTDFALDNMFTVDGQIYSGGGTLDAGDPAGKDGILILDITHSEYVTLVTNVHPTDPSDPYYRQWQGVLSNDFGVGSFVVGQVAKIGVNLNLTAGYLYNYAFGSPSSVTMATNDILTVNWKIAVG